MARTPKGKDQKGKQRAQDVGDESSDLGDTPNMQTRQQQSKRSAKKQRKKEREAADRERALEDSAARNENPVVYPVPGKSNASEVLPGSFPFDDAGSGVELPESSRGKSGKQADKTSGKASQQASNKTSDKPQKDKSSPFYTSQTPLKSSQIKKQLAVSQGDDETTIPLITPSKSTSLPPITPSKSTGVLSSLSNSFRRIVPIGNRTEYVDRGTSPIDFDEKDEVEDGDSDDGTDIDALHNLDEEQLGLLHGFWNMMADDIAEYWTTRKPYSRVLARKTQGIFDQELRAGVDLPEEYKVLPFNELRVKLEALKLVQKATPEAWMEAENLLQECRETFEAMGYPPEFSPPKDFLERMTGRKKPVGDKKIKQENETAEQVEHVSVADTDDESPEFLSKDSNAPVVISREGNLLGYARGGFGSYTALVKEGIRGYERHRLLPSKSVLNFQQKFRSSIDLKANQRIDDTKEWDAAKVEKIKAVAWVQRFSRSNNPLFHLIPKPGTRLPVTRILIQWSDGKTTWETRSGLRAIYPSETADYIIYERARRAEMKYHQGNGKGPLQIPKMVRDDSRDLGYEFSPSPGPETWIPRPRSRSRTPRYTEQAEPQSSVRNNRSRQESAEPVEDDGNFSGGGFSSQQLKTISLMMEHAVGEGISRHLGRASTPRRTPMPRKDPKTVEFVDLISEDDE